MLYTPKGGSAIREFIDAETYLILRTVQTVDRAEAGGEIEQTSDATDYRDEGGFKVPFSIATVSAALSVLVAAVAWAPATPLAQVVQNFAPLAWIFAGYRLSGLLFAAPQPGVEARFARFDARVQRAFGMPGSIERAPRLLLECLEVCYLCCYPALPAGLIAVSARARGGDADCCGRHCGGNIRGPRSLRWRFACGRGDNARCVGRGVAGSVVRAGAAPRRETPMKSRKVCIAVPAYGHLVQSACLESICQTQATLLSRGIGCGLLTVSIPHISIARNVLATRVLEDGTYSHLLFVDADMAFSAKTVLKMLRANKAVIGCTYPAKSLDVASLVGRARKHPREDPRAVATNVQRYVVKHLPGKPVIVNGLCRVAGIGMGLCLIRTDALRTIAAGGVSRFDGPWFWTAGEIVGPVLGLFDPLPLRGGYMPEDYSFCVRWNRCAGEVFALVTEDVAHVGQAVFSGPYADQLLAGSSRRGRVRARRR